MERGALNDPLEAVGRFRLFLTVDNEIFKFSIKVLNNGLAKRVDVDSAGAQHCRRVDVVDQGEQQMLEGRVFMTAFVRERKRSTERLF